MLAATALPLLLFLVLRPESFGLTPNGLDPWFYTGYAHNFDDLMAAVGDRYYFVTRWTAYTPGRITAFFLGPGMGRMGLRWIAATTLLMALWHLGRRWRWTAPTELVVGVVALSMPMFARAFLTDYVEWFFVVVGLLLTTQCLEPQRSMPRHVAVGALFAAVVIANPFAVYLALAPIGYYILSQSNAWKVVAARVVGMIVGSLVVIAAGFIAFRVFYGVPNVYEPTIDFVSSSTDYRDRLKSPRLEWLGAFTWIYNPILLAVSAALLQRRHRSHPVLRDGSRVAGILLGVYGLLVIDQFVRDGNGLEIPYYWSLAVPTVLVGAGFMIGAWNWSWRQVFLILGAWWLCLVASRLVDVRLPGGGWLVVIAVLAIAVMLRVGSSRPALASVSLILVVLVTQVFPPGYDPSSYHPYNTHPDYRGIFYRAGSGNDELWEDMQFALKHLDRVDDNDLYFWQGIGPHALALSALYGGFITNHNLVPDEGGGLNAASRRLINTEIVDRLVATGHSTAVDTVLSELSGSFDSVTLLVDERYERDAGLRLAVVEIARPRWPRRWLADELNALTGETIGTSRVAQPGQQGFVAFGPGVVLEPGSYAATYHYSVDGPVNASAGWVDVAVQESDVTKAAEFFATGGDTGTISIAFDVGVTSSWQFRVYSNGEYAVRVDSIELARDAR